MPTPTLTTPRTTSRSTLLSTSRPVALAGLGALLLLAACRPAAAQYAHLTLQSQPGDFVGQGQNYDITYTPANVLKPWFFAEVNGTVAGGLPAELDFMFLQPTPRDNDTAPDNNAMLSFGTNQLGIPMQPGTYTNAQRAAFAAPGHAGLDISFDHRGENGLAGSFTIQDFTYTTTTTQFSTLYTIDTFDATFEQRGGGQAAALFGQFSYRGAGSPAVPEASTTASFGLLLALGMGGLVVAAKRKKATSSL